MAKTVEKTIEPKTQALTIDPKKAKVPKAEPKETYYMGTTDDSPIQNVVMGGKTFPSYHEEIKVEEAGGVTRIRKKGHFAPLTERQVNAVLTEVSRHVVDKHNRIQKVDHESYRWDEKHKPLGQYLFMIKLGDSLPIDWRENDPPTLIPKEE